MEINNALSKAIEIAKPFEGLSLNPYHDPAGYPTVGYGHLLSYKKWDDLSNYKSVTEDAAHFMLQEDMSEAVIAVAISSPVVTKQGNEDRWAALSDFVFNLGITKYNSSRLKKAVDAQDWGRAKELILMWDKAGGKKLKGLTLRRIAEAGLL